MKEIAVVEAGARISRSTSNHSDYTPTNILDSGIPRPWLTSGMYPDYFVITFPTLMDIQSIDIKCCNVKDILVECSASNPMSDLEEIAEKTFSAPKALSVQKENITNEELQARHIKVTILSGYDHFSGVFKLNIMGSEASSINSGKNSFSFGKTDLSTSMTVATGDGERQESPAAFPFSDLVNKSEPDFRFGEAFHAPKRPEPEPDLEGEDDEQNVEGVESEYAQGYRIPTFKRVRMNEPSSIELPVSAATDAFGNEDVEATIRNDDDDDDALDIGGEVSWNPVLPSNSPREMPSDDNITTALITGEDDEEDTEISAFGERFGIP